MKTPIYFFAFALLLGTAVWAQQPTLTLGRRISLASTQRMLTQRMAKDYIYLWRKTNEADAKAQMLESIDAFEATQRLFMDNPLAYQEVQHKLADVQTNWTAYKKVLTDPAMPTDIGPFLLQANQMLLVTDVLVKEIEKFARTQPGFNADAKVDSKRSIVNVMSRQRMFNQRLTALYAVYEAQPTDVAIKTTFLEAVKLWQDDWTLIQSFIKADPESFKTVTSSPEYQEMLTRRQEYETLVNDIKQNKRVDLLALWTATRALGKVLDKVVVMSEAVVDK